MTGLAMNLSLLPACKPAGGFATSDDAALTANAFDSAWVGRGGGAALGAALDDAARAGDGGLPSGRRSLGRWQFFRER